MRLIDADALIDEIKYIVGEDTIMWFDSRKINREQEVNMAAFINAMPTTDPVKHGKWEMRPDPYGFFDEIPVCSECGCTTKMRETYRCCPNCGARMQERSAE